MAIPFITLTAVQELIRLLHQTVTILTYGELPGINFVLKYLSFQVHFVIHFV
jgi:hypothetical protein